MFGTQTSSIFAGGDIATGQTAANESWNGSAWTEVADLNQTKKTMGAAGTDNTTGLVFGGGVPGRTANTETWNGSSWTEVGNLPAVVDSNTGTGSPLSALTVGGHSSTAITGVTNEWTVPETISNLTITD